MEDEYTQIEPTKVQPKDETLHLRFVQSLLLTALSGAPHLRFRSARELARHYRNKKYKSNQERIDALIRREVSKNFSTGFVGSVGGLITLPLSIPAGLSASWIIQTRLAAAIADIYGHDLGEQRIQTLSLICILGDSGKELLKRATVSTSVVVAEQAIGKISSELLTQINQQIGLKLLATAGGTGLMKLTNLVPVAGGLVGGTIDAVACGLAGTAAKSYFGDLAKDLDIVDVEVLDVHRTVK